MGKITNTTRYARYKFYSQGALYHIYNRGNGKQDIFREEADYQFYLNRLKKYLEKHDVSLICYALIPNHVHLVVKQETAIPIYKLISSLHTSYSIYFNKKYNHIGHLFQDRFKQVIIESDEQLLYLTKYVHLNPVEAELVKNPQEYAWSSYREYMGIDPSPLCKKEIIINLLDSKDGNFPKKYAEFCNSPFSDKEADTLEQLILEPF